MNLSEKQMIAIIKEKRISECNKSEKEQVTAFAFGENYMKAKDNGAKKFIKGEK